MNKALEPSGKDATVAIGIQGVHPVVAPDLATEGIDNAAAEDATGTEGPPSVGGVDQHLATSCGKIHDGATVGRDVVLIGGAKHVQPLLADKVVGWQDHVLVARPSEFKGSIVLGSEGAVRALRELNAEVLEHCNIIGIPFSNSSGHLSDTTEVRHVSEPNR